jgi:hypothetical protein
VPMPSKVVSEIEKVWAKEIKERCRGCATTRNSAGCALTQATFSPPLGPIY